MGREPSVYWHKHAGCYASNSGVGENGERKTLYFRGFAKSDKRGAMNALKAYHDAREASVIELASPRVETLAELYLQHTAKTCMPRTLEGHIEILSKFADFQPAGSNTTYGERLARTIRAQDLIQMVRAWEEAGYSPSYRARLVRTMKGCWTWAAAADPYRNPERLIPANPFKDVKGVHVPQSPERYATRKEIADFLRFAWRRADVRTPLHRKFGRLFVLMLRVMAATGARPGEICDAQWSDFHPERRTIVLPPDRHKTGRKTGKPRIIAVPPLLCRAILRVAQKQEHHPVYIFTHKRGKGAERRGAIAEFGEPWESKALSKAIAHIRTEAIKAGVPLLASGPNAFVAYRIRHTWISDAIMNGIPTAVAAEMAGTSERMIAQTYGHIVESRIQEAAAFMVRRPRKRTSN